MEERREELRGFTVDRIKELCTKAHIKTYGKTKDDLIAQLLEVESTGKTGTIGGAEGGETSSLTTHLMEMIVQMQRDQRAWLEGQQKRQEELMEQNQRAQREMVNAVLAVRAPSMTDAPPPGATVKPPRPTLQKLSSSDDVESYLDMFERVARQQGWPEGIWATQLAGLLSGDALDAFSSLPADAAREYARVKEAILTRYEVNAETYRLRFRGTRRKSEESYKMLLSRQLDQLNRWTRSSGSELKQNILHEQFLQSLPTDLAVKLRERKPTTAKEAAGWADDYDQAHRGQEQTGSQGKQPLPRDEANLPPRPFPKRGTPKKGTAGTGGSAGSSFRSKTNSKGELQCFDCRKWGHIAAFCPDKQSSGAKADVKPAMLSQKCPEITSSDHAPTNLLPGALDGQPVQVLIDTGSRMSAVRADLVDQSKWKEEEVKLQCVHGDIVSYPVAEVTYELEGWKKEISVAVVPGLPVDTLIGKDDHLSFIGVMTNLAVMTRSQKQKQMKELDCRQGGGDGVAENREGNGPASARGPVNQYLHWQR